MPVGFNLKKGVNRVEINLSSFDAPIVVDGYFEAHDPRVINALDSNKFVERAEKPVVKKGED